MKRNPSPSNIKPDLPPSPFIIYWRTPSSSSPPLPDIAYTVGTCPTCHGDAFEVTTHGDREPVYLCWSCETRRAATGPTQRLIRHCNACGDALPTGAAFCVVCGARVEEPR